MLICSIYDSAVEAFQSPFVIHTEVLAVRAFRETVEGGGNNPLAKYPFDHTLFAIGEFNDQNGLITPYDAPKRLISGFDCAVKRPATQPAEGVQGGEVSPACNGESAESTIKSEVKNA